MHFNINKDQQLRFWANCRCCLLINEGPSNKELNIYTFVNIAAESLLLQQRDAQGLVDETSLCLYRREQQPKRNLLLVYCPEEHSKLQKLIFKVKKLLADKTER